MDDKSHRALLGPFLLYELFAENPASLLIIFCLKIAVGWATRLPMLSMSRDPNRMGILKDALRRRTCASYNLMLYRKYSLYIYYP